MTESLLLKWGTIKGWDNFSEKSQGILRRFFADGMRPQAQCNKP
jgi:hypothetical protein